MSPHPDHRPRPHRFVPKAGFSWRWCVICDRKDTDPIHRVDDDPREAA
mgnify:CR=1 FL=1